MTADDNGTAATLAVGIPNQRPSLRLSGVVPADTMSPFGTSVDLLVRVGSLSPVAARARRSRPSFQTQQTYPNIVAETKLNVPLLTHVDDESLDLGEAPKKSSYMQTTFNSINLLCGLGLLSYPFALRCSGWSGLCVLFFLTLTTLYTASILGKCMAMRPHIRTLPEIGLEAYGRPMEIFIGIIFFIELYLAGSVAFLVVEGDNLNKLFPDISRATFMIIATFIVLPTTWLKDFSVLSYLSAFGVISSTFLMGSVMYTSANQDYPSGPPKTVAFRLSTFPQSVGLLLIGFGGHAVFPNIYTSMKSPKRYGSMLSVTYVVVFLVYALTSCIGYATFGDQTLKEITLNLSSGPVSRIAVWMVVANPLSKFALTLSPIVVQVQNLVPSRYHTPMYRRYNRVVISTVFTMMSLGTALILPMFDRLLEFTGSLCTSTVSLTYPALCYIKICGHRMGRVEYAFNVFLATLGISMAIIGTATSIYGPIPTDYEVFF